MHQDFASLDYAREPKAKRLMVEDASNIRGGLNFVVYNETELHQISLD
jgi:hypothetical protein